MKNRNLENTCAFLRHIATHEERVITIQIIWLHIKRNIQGKENLGVKRTVLFAKDLFISSAQKGKSVLEHCCSTEDQDPFPSSHMAAPSCL